MFEIISLLIMVALTWFFSWSWGDHLVTKGYVKSWEAIRSDWWLVLLVVTAGAAGANGLLFLIGLALKAIGWLLLL